MNNLNDQEVIILDEIPKPAPRSFCFAVISDAGVEYDRVLVGERIYGYSDSDDDSIFTMVSPPCARRKLTCFSKEELTVGKKTSFFFLQACYGYDEVLRDFDKLDMVFLADSERIAQILPSDFPDYVDENSWVELIEYRLDS